MPRWFFKLALFAIAPIAIAFSCADPTAIEVNVFSEIPCATNADVSFSMAKTPDALQSAAPAAVATRCDDQGDGTVRRGYVVLTPVSDKSKLVAFEVKTRNDNQPLDACVTDPKKCITARRELRFQPNNLVTVRVDLRLSCLGVECPVGDTCVKGTCVGDSVPASCGSACDESTLPGVDAGAPDTSVPDTGPPDTSVADAADAAPPNIVLAAGGSHVCAITQAQQLKCWGENNYGQIDATLMNHASPTLVPGITPTRLGLGWSVTCAIEGANAVKCWGHNSSGELGVNSMATQLPTPTAVTTPLTYVAGGSTQTCGLAANGDLYCWGSGSNGQIGTMVGTTSKVPLLVPGISQVVGVAGGDLFTCAWTKADARCFGANNVGQLGNSGNTQTATPTLITGSQANIVQISAGSDNVCALFSDGSVKCWGDNSSGECGDGTVGGSRSTPTAVIGLGGPVTMLAGGGPHMCALRNDGTVWCWGNDGAGQLGDNANSNRGTPKAVLNVSNATSIASTGGGTCAVISGKSVVCWGDNTAGQIGDGTFKQRPVATPVIGL